MERVSVPPALFSPKKPVSFIRVVLAEGYTKWLRYQSREIQVAHELMDEEASFREWLRQEMVGGLRRVWDDPVIRQWPEPTLENFKRDTMKWAKRYLAEVPR